MWTGLFGGRFVVWQFRLVQACLICSMLSDGDLASTAFAQNAAG